MLCGRGVCVSRLTGCENAIPSDVCDKANSGPYLFLREQTVVLLVMARKQLKQPRKQIEYATAFAGPSRPRKLRLARSTRRSVLRAWRVWVRSEVSSHRSQDPNAHCVLLVLHCSGNPALAATGRSAQNVRPGFLQVPALACESLRPQDARVCRKLCDAL